MRASPNQGVPAVIKLNNQLTTLTTEDIRIAPQKKVSAKKLQLHPCLEQRIRLG